VTANPLRYIAGYQEATNLYKLGARYYDATTGRFTQFDPAGQEANPYSYAGCNPINAKDPTGTATACAVAAGVFGAVSFVAGVTSAIAGTLAAPVTGGVSLAATVSGISLAVSVATGAPATLLIGPALAGKC